MGSFEPPERGRRVERIVTCRRVPEPPHSEGSEGRSHVSPRSAAIPLSNSLCHDPVGLEGVNDGVWPVYICHLRLTRVDLRTGGDAQRSDPGAAAPGSVEGNRFTPAHLRGFGFF